MSRFLSLSLLLGLAAFLGYATAHLWPKEDPKPPQVEVQEHPTPAVVNRLQALSRLEGAEFHMEKIVDLTERQSRFRGLIETEDNLLLVAVGDVTAGVDLSKLVSAQVETSADGKSVRLQLPHAEVFRASLDSERTYVYKRTTDVLAHKSDQLETKARKRATEALRAGALQAGVLERAEVGVKRTLTALLLGLGFETVTIEFAPPVAAAHSE